MKCPFCKQNQNSVIDTRDGSDGEYIWRRRQCGECNGRFTTYERIEENPRKVIKKDGSKETYRREKLRKSIELAMNNLLKNEEELNQIVNQVEQKVFQKQSGEITSEDIGETVLKRLKDANQVAYIRYASVFREFEHPTDFVSELKSIVND